MGLLENSKIRARIWIFHTNKHKDFREGPDVITATDFQNDPKTGVITLTARIFAVLDV